VLSKEIGFYYYFWGVLKDISRKMEEISQDILYKKLKILSFIVTLQKNVQKMVLVHD